MLHSPTSLLRPLETPSHRFCQVSATPPLPGSEEPKAELQGPNQSERASMSSGGLSSRGQSSSLGFYPLPDKADFRILEACG